MTSPTGLRLGRRRDGIVTLTIDGQDKIVHSVAVMPQPQPRAMPAYPKLGMRGASLLRSGGVGQ